MRNSVLTERIELGPVHRQTEAIMSTDDTSRRDWKELYQKAVLETDPAKMPQRITEAHKAILDRIEELLTNPTQGEHRALDIALRRLSMLQNKSSAKKNSA
jgi:hypothetical protein